MKLINDTKNERIQALLAPPLPLPLPLTPDQVKIDWEKTFPEGFSAQVLAALWRPEAAATPP